jgi:hypothetical protein
MRQDAREKIKYARQREVICRLMIDLMRNVHGAYAPNSEPFGTRIEAFFIALCVAIGDLDGKPFSVSKIAGYMRVPRATVMRRLERLQEWGLVRRHGHYYFLQPRALNSIIGLENYQKTRRKIKQAMDELSILDTRTG